MCSCPPERHLKCGCRITRVSGGIIGNNYLFGKICDNHIGAGKILYDVTLAKNDTLEITEFKHSIHKLHDFKYINEYHKKIQEKIKNGH